jgi:hypothetical protein
MDPSYDRPSILDGLDPEQRALVLATIDRLAAIFADVPDLRDTLLYPESGQVRGRARWATAIAHLGYVEGWYAHRQLVLEEAAARHAGAGVPTMEDLLHLRLREAS